MSAVDADERPQEIIIVRRSSEDEEGGHHGGAWKIAFADFMTAMMCFFLVMWLINAANEQTKAALASYFNPVKLVDRNTNRRGLDDLGKGPHESSVPDTKKTSETPAKETDGMSGPAENPDSTDAAEKRKFSDQNLFSDPYSVLAEIAADTGTKQNTSQKGDGGAQLAGPSSGASGGESYRDPFAPDFWTQQVAVPRDGVQGDPDTAREKASGADIKAAESGKQELAKIGDAVPNDGRIAKRAADPSAEAPAVERVAPVQPLVVASKPDATRQEAKPDEGSKAAAKAQAKRESMAEEIRTELNKEFAGENLEAHIAVDANEDGVLITITDDQKHGMFPIGSAVPHHDLVLAMDKIGHTLAERDGNIRINGHTDGRPFSSKDYDNWRLSTARAHAAYYMLVRGGLAERRVVEVAGFADRKLKVPGDPFSDENRRIEVVLEMPK